MLISETTPLRPRLFEVDLVPRKYNLPFNGRNHDVRLMITAYGDLAIRSSDCSMILIESRDEAAASKYFGKVAQRVTGLFHQDRNLRDNIQVNENTFFRVIPPLPPS